jgi:hypothetical protein
MVDGVIVLKQFIVGGQNGPTGQPEHHIHPFMDQALPNNLAAGFLLAHGWTPFFVKRKA